MSDFAVIFVIVLAVLVLPVVFFVGTGILNRKRIRRRARLTDSYTRMIAVVAELLERVDDLDQATKLVANSEVLSERVKVAAEDLVTVTGCIQSIKESLEANRLDDAADLLSGSTRVIEKVKRLVDQVEPHVRLIDKRALGSSEHTLKLPKREKTS